MRAPQALEGLRRDMKGMAPLGSPTYSSRTRGSNIPPDRFSSLHSPPQFREALVAEKRISRTDGGGYRRARHEPPSGQGGGYQGFDPFG